VFWRLFWLSCLYIIALVSDVFESSSSSKWSDQMSSVQPASTILLKQVSKESQGCSPVLIRDRPAQISAGDKTAVIRFTRNSSQSADDSITVEGQEVQPTSSVKLLGLLMGSRLLYQEQIARATTRGLQAAMALKQLRGLSPSVSCKLFNTTKAPVVDFPSSV